MKLSITRSLGVVAALCVALALGCGGGDQGAAPKKPAEKEKGAAEKGEGGEAKADSHGDHEHADAGEIEAALAQLSPEDRKVAEAQKVCPVSGEPLGSMGKPIKVTFRSQEAFLCCKSCQDEFNSDQEGYMAKAKSSGASEG